MIMGSKSIKVTMYFVARSEPSDDKLTRPVSSLMLSRYRYEAYFCFSGGNFTIDSHQAFYVGDFVYENLKTTKPETYQFSSKDVCGLLHEAINARCDGALVGQVARDTTLVLGTSTTDER